MSLIDRLLKLASLWAAANDRSTSRLATVVANDGKLFDRLAGGSSCTIATFERFLTFFRDEANWPDRAIPTDVAELLASVTMEAGVDHAATDTLAEQSRASGKSAPFAGCSDVEQVA